LIILWYKILHISIVIVGSAMLSKYQETVRMADVIANMHKEYQIGPVIVIDIRGDRVIIIDK
jgi:hypothetical protein